ncbi:MAG: FAD:protein FMN transferase [Deltaproteobacteria bacterium]|nr:FAD:protein FMN transferase [Deltaproteobacteria bacterium]
MVIKNQFNRRNFLKYSLSFAAGGAMVAILNPYLRIGNRILEILNPGLEKPFRKSFLSMGSFVDIAIYDRNMKYLPGIMAKAEEEILAIDRLMSSFTETSDLAKVNRAAGHDSVTVDARLCEVMAMARDIGRRTDGVFDPTVLPLLQLYGLRNNHPRIPDERSLEKTLTLVDYRRIHVSRADNRVGLEKQGMAADLGGIAVGYAVDRAVAVLKAHGIEKAVINAGGEVYALGKPAGQEGWHIGIQHPRIPNRLAGKIVLADKAVSTSGNYEFKAQSENRNLGHLFDPYTGAMPDPMLSATVTADTTMEADALSTTAFLMGTDRAAAFITRQRAAGAVFALAGTGQQIDMMRSGRFPKISA